jgi:D-3-phosphoglycerate dehydrogenase
MASEKYKVVTTDRRFSSYKEEESVLSAVGASFEIYDCRTKEELIDAVHDADGVILNLNLFDKEVLGSMEKCKVISRYGIGLDNIDIEAATEKGIWISNVPEYGAEEDVADQAVAHLFGCIRKVPYKDKRIKSGAWNVHDEQPCYRIKGKNLGIIGYGRIGRSFHKKLSGFGFGKVLIFDPYVKPDEVKIDNCPNCQVTDFETLMKEADHISIHALATEETKHMINADALNLAKKTLILVNTSRGALIDEKALADWLAKNPGAYAGLDVFEEEPLPEDSPLLKLDNIILSDHAGFYSEESLVELKTKAAQNVAEVLKGNKPLYPVNNPS